MAENLEELIYGIGHMLEAMRLEMRATSRRRDGDAKDALYYENKADAESALAAPAINNPLDRKEGG